jgi:hypothetical protein
MCYQYALIALLVKENGLHRTRKMKESHGLREPLIAQIALGNRERQNPTGDEKMMTGKRITNVWTVAVVAMGMVWFGFTASTQGAEIYSADFETSDCADGSPTYKTGNATDPWLSETEWDGTAGMEELHAGTYATHLSGIGGAFAVIHGGNTLWADLGINFADNTTYTFSFDHFRRSDVNGDAVTAQIHIVGGTVLATTNCPAVTGTTASDIVNRSVSFTTSGGAEVGQTTSRWMRRPSPPPPPGR